MDKTYHITIEGLTNPKKFVEDWSMVYDYPQEEKYTSNIGKGLDDDVSLQKLFEWKNGTGDKIYDGKIGRVDEFIGKRGQLKQLRNDLDLIRFEELIQPEKGAVIWKIFLLHIINPDNFPIYDQHVYRTFRFFTKGTIENRPKKDKDYYRTYKNEYVEWFNILRGKFDLNSRDMDKSFFMFGRTLKSLNSKPIKIYELGV